MNAPPTGPRRGLLAGGNFIIDYVKMIDAYPAQDMLVNIRSETRSNGGGAYNVLKDLARMNAGFPLEAAGMIGSDANGEWIVEDCVAHGIDVSQLRRSPTAATSYTDAMTVISTGRRTFFHQRGANALLAPEHFDFSATGARIFHLAYLMLLDTLDALDAEGRSGASRVLEAASTAGLTTTVDLVSIDQPDFADRVNPSLPFVDYLFLNELEAALLLGRPLPDIASRRAAARELLDRGIRRAVVLHFEEGAVAAERDGTECLQPSLDLPADHVAGATGAGDAFVAGVLHGIHEDEPLAAALRLGVAAAAACLAHPSPSQGVGSLDECRSLLKRFPERRLPAS